MHHRKNVAVDDKEIAGNTFAEVLRATRDLFPEAAYRPQPGPHGLAIASGRHLLTFNSDGTGTKPELVERGFLHTGDYSLFERPAHDVVAMVADDAARDGHFTVGIVNCVDVNSAHDTRFVTALARGMEQACRWGGFPLLNGETAELGYRAPGQGASRLNWNAVAVALVNREKEFQPTNLRPGQVVVALRDTSIRSNGLSRARRILEHAYLSQQHATRKDWAVSSLSNVVERAARQQVVMEMFSRRPELAEQLIIPWHERYGDLVERLSRPSTIYSSLIYAAQGGVDGPVQIPIVACVHVTGGGIPLKCKRLLRKTGLGIMIDSVFPDPEGVAELLALANQFPLSGRPLVDDREACEQWNRGIGFLCVVPDSSVARDLITLAEQHSMSAAIAGNILDDPAIHFRGHTWRWE
ncbi:MAG: AIR synthase-related protein [Planctomycetota bacterium]